MMAGLLPPRITAVWAFLVGATLASWWLGAEHAVLDAQSAAVAVLLVAFVKVRFVGMAFMDLRTAPTALRVAFDAWCSLTAALVVTLYLLA